MALLHRAELRPSKLELLAEWLPGRPWFAGEAGAPVTRVAAYRFDDPAGEVGMETLLVRAGEGPVLQAPLTYRGAPLAGADRFLVGIVEHSVLGRRWVYDACGDPVYPPALAAAVFADAGQAEEYFEADGERQVRPPSMAVSGSRTDRALPAGPADEVVDADPTVIRVGGVELALVRRPTAADVRTGVPADVSAAGRLVGAWPGGDAPVLLAYAR
ncbi:CG0192-related protein [Micromonospora schwarzwaldensis]|uniref:CG0192-related protein n=1 Tax=Micromonospora sp. DSM 45708 TaxID=3111767 RepID=UPI0031CFAAC6